MDMTRIKLIAKREWTTRMAQRSFRIVTLVQVLIILVGACVPTIIARFSDNSVSETHIVVVDESHSAVAEQLTPYFSTTGNAEGIDKIVIDASNQTADQERVQVNSGKIDGLIVVTRDGAGQLAFTYETKSGDNDTTAQRVYAAASALSVQDRLAQAGISAQEFSRATAPPTFNVQATDSGNSKDSAATGARYAVGFAFAILMFMAIMLYGQWVAQGVVEEKSSRIMEIMINAATPRDLLAGKVIGIALAGFTQLVPMLLVGGIAFAAQPRLADALGVKNDTIASIDFSSISVTAISAFLVYFIIGFALYASLFASVGSLVSRQEEVSQAVAPLTTVMMLGYFGAIFTVNAPDSVVATILSIFPLTAPFTMVMRIVVGHPAMWEVALSIGLLVVAAVIGIMFAARVYRVGVLMYGQKPSWKAVFKSNAVQAAR
ncbi:MAG: ABC transporter permease [Thermomicrobiales bacterium]